MPVWEQAEPRLRGHTLESLMWHLRDSHILAWLPAAPVLRWVAGDPSCGVIAMSLVHPYGDQLPELTRELVQEFGWASPVTLVLSIRARVVPDTEDSRPALRRRQLACAEIWAQDDIAELRRWAQAFMARLREIIAMDEAQVAGEYR